MTNRFTKNTRLFLCISGAIILIALIMQICGVGLNLGIDFTGGSILEYSIGEDYDINDVSALLASVGYDSAQITKAAPSRASIALQEQLKNEIPAGSAEDSVSEDANNGDTEAAGLAEAAPETEVESSEEATENAPVEGSTEEASSAHILNMDKSGVVRDGLTDLQIRLRLIDTASEMTSCISETVQNTVSGSSFIESSQLTYQAITQNGYDPDFTGGYILDFDMATADYDTEEIENIIRNALDAGGYSINNIALLPYSSGDSDEETGLRILVDLNDATSQVRSVLEREMSAKYPGFHFISIDHVSAIAGRDLLSNAIKALLIAFALMLVYIAIRFSPLSGLTAMLALFHDVLIMMSFMVFFRAFYQVNSSFIAALLTIIGYSINNTIIIFDRIREDQSKPGYTLKPKMEIVEMSVSSTLSRTINTTITTLITLVALYVFGVEAIRQFAFPLIIGMLAGTYSSVLLSGQVWAIFSEKLAKGKKKA